MDLDWPVALTGIGESWREERKILDRSLGASATMSYRQMMEQKTHWFLGQLFVNPKAFPNHLELSVLVFHLPCMLLTIKQSSRETYHGTHIWLQSKLWRRSHGNAH